MTSLNEFQPSINCSDRSNIVLLFSFILIHSNGLFMCNVDDIGTEDGIACASSTSASNASKPYPTTRWDWRDCANTARRWRYWLALSCLHCLSLWWRRSNSWPVSVWYHRMATRKPSKPSPPVGNYLETHASSPLWKRWPIWRTIHWPYALQLPNATDRALSTWNELMTNCFTRSVLVVTDENLVTSSSIKSKHKRKFRPIYSFCFFFVFF